MRPPTIRYPLLWLAGILAAIGLFEVARPALSGLKNRLQSRVVRAIEGPPVPASAQPQVIAGALTRQGLLLESGVTPTDRPGGKPLETISQRLFVDIYDVWPPGRPTHVRIGTRQPLGWIPREALLPWDTRLVVLRRGQKEVVPMPVLGWDGDRVEVAVWAPGAPWGRVDHREWLEPDAVAERGVMLSRVELAALIDRLLGDPKDESRNDLRVRLVLGRLLDPAVLRAEAVAAARKALPDWVEPGPGSTGDALGRLTQLNEHWRADASWGGLEFRLVGLDDLP